MTRRRTLTECEKRYTLVDASKQVGVSVRTLRRWVDNGTLPYFEQSGDGGSILIPASALEYTLRTKRRCKEGDLEDIEKLVRKALAT